MTSAWLIPIVTVVSALLTGALYRYAIVWSVLDVPNSRSAHTKPTPRGGGIAIVVSFLGAVVFLRARGVIEFSVTVAVVGAGALVALVGFLDDHKPLAVHVRLPTHFIAAMWGLAWLGGLAPVAIGNTLIDLGWAGHILATVGLVWLLNLYNFMDGIDGLAGLEATMVFGAAATLSGFHSADHAALLPAVLAASSLGFLVWNWPPARIFMGDAGSGFVGLMAGLLAVRAGRTEPQIFWVWMILLGVFVVDATVTLLHRLIRRERAFQAHNDHGYQYAARESAHKKVTLAVGAINLFWLIPIATIVTLGWLDGARGLVIAYAPLVWIAIRLKSATVAGQRALH